MSIFDSIIGSVTEHVDVADLAKKVGIDPAMAEKAITALAQAHPQPGDTAEIAAAKTGLDTGTLNSIIGHIGGEGSLTEFSNILNSPEAAGIEHMLDRNHDGSVIDDVAGMAKGIFGQPKPA
ncbi:MAG: hypothetical protein J2O44_01980 [Porphyrobacter sp.]|nr:hypothetical protein [Porphyrobacter sp.]